MAKSNKRVKSRKIIPFKIKDWEGADNCIRRMGSLQDKMTQYEQECQRQIDELKEELQKQVATIQENITIYLASLEAFCDQRKKEFGRQRSRKLTFGKLGWRRSTAISISKKYTLDLIKMLFTPAQKKECIITKEAVDKNALAKLTDDTLAGVKARREERDVFFVEPDRTEAADYQK